jgi:hypothetical protein
MTEIERSGAACVERIREILKDARSRALQSVNVAMIAAYWHIGREIVEEEQLGADRAVYGARLIGQLSARLMEDFGRGFSVPNLKLIRQFYVAFSDRRPIGYTPSSQSPFLPHLSWSHYRILMRIAAANTRSFYEVECDKARWSVRELERQIASLLFERLARSRDKEGVLALAREGHEVYRAADLVKDPYILEFTGLPEGSRWLD